MVIENKKILLTKAYNILFYMVRDNDMVKNIHLRIFPIMNPQMKIKENQLFSLYANELVDHPYLDAYYSSIIPKRKIEITTNLVITIVQVWMEIRIKC